MNQSKEYRIQYSAKQARIANGWKKWIGENRGIKRLKTIDKKQNFEVKFQQWINNDETLKANYGNLLEELEKTHRRLSPLNYNATYILESGLSVELLRYCRSFKNLVSLSRQKESSENEIIEEVNRLKKAKINHFKNYKQVIDKEIFVAMMREYSNNVMEEYQPSGVKDLFAKYNMDFSMLADDIFRKSVFTSEENIEDMLSNYKKSKHKKIVKDPAFSLANELAAFFNEQLLPGIIIESAGRDSLMRIYMQAQMEMQPVKKFYPDANLTLRIAYGNVSGFQPDDAVTYNYFTTLDGILEKEDPEIYDYFVDSKLKTLYSNRDFGRYADSDGTMHVCFIASNHTTGGNSGSPVLDANGNLLGLNFDRSWEGTMSDIVYDETQCRNITLDIRYCLFIIDKFAGAGHLIEEMTIVD